MSVLVTSSLSCSHSRLQGRPLHRWCCLHHSRSNLAGSCAGDARWRHAYEQMYEFVSVFVQRHEVSVPITHCASQSLHPAMRPSQHRRVDSEDGARLKLVRSGSVTGAVSVVCTLLFVSPGASSTSLSRLTAQVVPEVRVSGNDSIRHDRSGLSCRLNGGYHDQQCPTCSYTLNQRSPTEVALSCAGDRNCRMVVFLSYATQRALE